MADINEVSGVFGGVEFGTENQGSVGTQNFENAGKNLPVKTGFWNSFKAVCLKEIKVELTPRQQKIENEINEFLHQEITWQKIHDFLFKEITFGKRNA